MHFIASKAVTRPRRARAADSEQSIESLTAEIRVREFPTAGRSCDTVYMSVGKGQLDEETTL